jgi:hypothetical protein
MLESSPKRSPEPFHSITMLPKLLPCIVRCRIRIAKRSRIIMWRDPSIPQTFHRDAARLCSARGFGGLAGSYLPTQLLSLKTWRRADVTAANVTHVSAPNTIPKKSWLSTMMTDRKLTAARHRSTGPNMNVEMKPRAMVKLAMSK